MAETIRLPDGSEGHACFSCGHAGPPAEFIIDETPGSPSDPYGTLLITCRDEAACRGRRAASGLDAYETMLDAWEESFFAWLVENFPPERRADVSDAAHGKRYVRLTLDEWDALHAFRS